MHKHVTKTTPVFLPADNETSWLLLPSSAFLLYQAAQDTQKALIPVFSR